MQPKSWRLPSRGKFLSCVPQPISLGCEPSLTKPSIDHVLTNSPSFFGTLEACVSCSATWITLTPRRRSEEHTSELQSQSNLVCRLLLEKKKKKKNTIPHC